MAVHDPTWGFGSSSSRPSLVPKTSTRSMRSLHTATTIIGLPSGSTDTAAIPTTSASIAFPQPVVRAPMAARTTAVAIRWLRGMCPPCLGPGTSARGGVLSGHSHMVGRRRTLGGMATIELTEENFNQTVEDSGILFVDFWASWCGPCRQFAPTYEAASEANPDLVFGSINTEEQRGLASAADVISIPTLMAFRDGILVYAQPGALPPAALDQIIGAVRALDMDDVRRRLAEQEG